MLTATLRTSVCAAAALVCVATTAFAFHVAPASRGDAHLVTVQFVNAPADPRDRNVEKAVERFVEGMARHDADSVWMFASEEDQDAFGTEKAVFDAYAETFPAFLKAETVSFGRVWQEGDTPFAELTVGDGNGNAFRATMGFWLDDAGDWKLVSCDVKPLSDKVASR